MLRLIARHAQEWNQWSAPGGFGERSAALDAACEKEGRDPATVWRSTQALVMVTDSPETEAKREGRRRVDAAAGRLRDRRAHRRGRRQPCATEGVDEVIVPDFGARGPRAWTPTARLAEAFKPLT